MHFLLRENESMNGVNILFRSQLQNLEIDVIAILCLHTIHARARVYTHMYMLFFRVKRLEDLKVNFNLLSN